MELKELFSRPLSGVRTMSQLSQKGLSGALKKVVNINTLPAIVLMAMTPSMINAEGNSRESLALHNSMNAVEMYEANPNSIGKACASTIRNHKVIGSKTFNVSEGTYHKFNMISTNSNDNDFEELEYFKVTDGKVTTRGMVTKVFDVGNGMALGKGLSLPLDDLDDYSIDENPKMFRMTSSATPINEYLREITVDNPRNNGVKVVDTPEKFNVITIQEKRDFVNKYKLIHHLP